MTRYRSYGAAVRYVLPSLQLLILQMFRFTTGLWQGAATAGTCVSQHGRP
jgi:hypothetical protein